MEEFTINSRIGAPNRNLTDEQWQDYFQKMKSRIPPSGERIMYKTRNGMFLNGADIPVQYDGETQYQRYQSFINDVLREIRSGRTEYCYFIYQIADLLRYEHDRLKTRYYPEDGCFTVWLVKEGEEKEEEMLPCTRRNSTRY